MATSYVVTATRLYTLDKDGNRRKHYRGDTVTGLSEDDVRRFKAAGAIATHSNDEANDAKENPAGPNPAETSLGEPTAPESHNPEGGSASTLLAQANTEGTLGGPSAGGRPAKAADLATWQAYATSVGVDVNDADGKPKSKAELQADTEGK